MREKIAYGFEPRHFFVLPEKQQETYGRGYIWPSLPAIAETPTGNNSDSFSFAPHPSFGFQERERDHRDYA